MKIVQGLAIAHLLIAIALCMPCRAAEEVPVRLLWPPPPNSPWLEFKAIFSSPNDFSKTKWQKILQVLLGEAPAERLQAPSGIVVRNDGKVLVAERKAGRIKVIDFLKKKVVYLFRTPLPPFDEPVDIALDADENLYVADQKKGTVSVFDKDLKPLFVLGKEVGFKRLEKIAVNDADKTIYVSDSALNKIFAFNGRGALLYSFGGQGKGHGRLRSPHGLAVNREGQLLVADTGNARIEVFDGKGKFLKTFRIGNDKTPSPLEKPWGIAFDGRGNLHVIDHGRVAVITCSPDGEILFATGTSQRSNHLLGFFRPSDIYIDAESRVLITDDLNKRFTIWQILTNSYLAENPVGKRDIERLVAYMKRLQDEYERTIARRDNKSDGKSSADVVSKQTRQGPLLRMLDGTPVRMTNTVTAASGQRPVKCPKCGMEFRTAPYEEAKEI